MKFFAPAFFLLGTYLLRQAVTLVFEARKLRRPNIRDKEGTRAYLENLIRWIIYFQGIFFKDLATPAFTLRILLELVQQGDKWDALYEALCHDFNISATFPPPQYQPEVPGTDQRERLIKRLILRLRKQEFSKVSFNDKYVDDMLVSGMETQMAEEYLAVLRQFLDHPSILRQSRQIFQDIIPQP